jgi:Zn finger protein HypA/HybF involved in hydrogenase expression
MYRLSFFLALILSLGLKAQNPHGDNFKIDCKECHNSSGWDLVLSELDWDHSQTGFALEGQHKMTDCMDCHKTLEFSDAEPNCVSCHNDLHEMTLGNDCVRCHDENSWLVNDIPQLHEQNGFPLEGSHAVISCSDCHLGANNLSFSRLGSECIDCHREDYLSAKEPDHLASGFGMDCVQCHEPISQDWAGDNFHYFFPLVQGHSNLDCAQCHQSTNYADISSACASCHLEDFNSTSNPDHRVSGFTTDCTLCHSLSPGWSPAGYNQHDDNHFPIYSGNHQAVWNSCTECHTNSANYTLFSCIDCHEHSNESEMRDEHSGVGGYRFESNACYSCHPTGEED